MCLGNSTKKQGLVEFIEMPASQDPIRITIFKKWDIWLVFTIGG